MMRAMWSAAAGMNVQTMNMDTISNNLANVNTAGFKKARAEFQDLLYQTINTAGSNSSTTTTQPVAMASNGWRSKLTAAGATITLRAVIAP